MSPNQRNVVILSMYVMAVLCGAAFLILLVRKVIPVTSDTQPSIQKQNENLQR